MDHWLRPVRENGILTLPAASVLTALPRATQLLPLWYCRVTGTPAATGSSAPYAVASAVQLLVGQSRRMSSVTFGDGAMVSISVRSLLVLRANTLFEPSTS